MEYKTVLFDTAAAWMPGVVVHLESWVRTLVSMSKYAERAWHDLSKGRWEARTHGLRKYAVMRPPSGDEEALLPISKSEKVIKRKRSSNSEGQKPKKRAVRTPKASVLHHEAFLQSRGELSRYEAEVRRLTEERDAFKLLSEQREGEVKRLQAELEASRKEQAELAEQVRAKEVAKAAQARENWVAEYTKCQSGRETLKEIHARVFDLTVEIEKAKELEVKTKLLVFPDDDDTGSTSGSDSEGGLEGEDAAPGED
ncbi:uncharacterized protein [Nicotiana tomentosiformis]|uniref:uncharacterized protein n=1 Tax=Nicotiana tomentosiformis TaxID=4098 RepID=UPI00388CBE05